MSDRNRFYCRTRAAAGGGQFAAQIGLGLARIFELVALALQLIIALGQNAALIGKPRFEILDAAIEHFRFGLLDKELPLEIGGSRAEIAELAARRGQFIRRGFGVGAFAMEPALGLLDCPLVIGDADFHRFDLGAERRDLGALAVGDQRSFAELAKQFRQLRFLVGELPLGLAQRARLDLEFLFG